MGEPTRIGLGELLVALGELPVGLAAEVYAACGYPVVPMHAPGSGGGCSCSAGRDCPSPGKHPRLASWPKQAATDPATVRSWWRRWPDAGVGLATGVRFDVLDADGPHGETALGNLFHRDPGEHPGPVARSGGGGWHLLYAPTGLGNRTGMLAGVDWRGRGGLIVVSPSRHHSGARYTWQRPLGRELPPVPAPLRRLLTPPPTRPAAPSLAPVPAGRGQVWAQGALRRERATVAAAQPGNGQRTGRNHTLNRAAFRLGQLVTAGLLDPEAVTAELLAAAGECGLGEREARATIASGLRGAATRPRAGLPWGASA